ncbi:MAG: S9 family peptidase [Deltaproteobacteria bacterium]|nr:S9 family peptidase [Deltaproteobacteria bacterium]
MVAVPSLHVLRLCEFSLLILLSACSSTPQPKIPTPPQNIEVFSARPDATLVEYLRDENTYTDLELGKFSALERELTEEIIDANPEQIVSAPLQIRPFEYSSVEQQTLRHPLIYRKKIGTEQPTLIFDPNVILGAYPQATLGTIRFSPHHQSLAFTVDLKHSGEYSLFVWNIAEQRISEISNADTQEMEWGKDDCTLYFTPRERERASSVRLWDCANTGETSPVYVEKNAGFTLALRRAKDGREILIVSESQTATRVFAIPLGSARTAPRELKPFASMEKFSINSDAGGYYIVKPDGSLWLLPQGQHTSARPIALPPGTRVESIEVFHDAILLVERQGALPTLAIYRPSNQSFLAVALPETVGQITRLPAPDYQATHARVGLESLISPRSVAEIDLRTAALRIVEPARYPPSFSASDFTVQQLLVPTPDGAMIPCTISSLKNNKGTAPLLLVGYGAYSHIGGEHFSASRLSLLRRGFRIVVAHVRGGGILGKNWYDAGRRMHKKQSFADFLTVAHYLVDHGYTTPQQLVAYGKSAGGLLVAAASGQEPSAFRAVVLDRPFVDVLAGLETTQSALSVREYDEWGDPQNEMERSYIESYSPVQQIATYQYPPLLVLSGMRDTVVPFWDVARWFALLRAKDLRLARKGQKTWEKLLWVSLTAGHDAEVDNYAEARLQARMNAFILAQAQLPEILD